MQAFVVLFLVLIFSHAFFTYPNSSFELMTLTTYLVSLEVFLCYFKPFVDQVECK